MIDVLDYAPIAAATLAIPQFLPQILKLRATRDTAGVSWAWALLTSLNNAAWIAYFTLARYWSALVPATAATQIAPSTTATDPRLMSSGRSASTGRCPGRKVQTSVG